MSLSFVFIISNHQGGQALTVKGLEGDLYFSLRSPAANSSVESNGSTDDGLTIVVISIAISIKITRSLRIYISGTIVIKELDNESVFVSLLEFL